MSSLQSSAPARHVAPVRPMRLAMIGTRGVPATDGGFETAVEEIGRRLVAQGHHVTVYGRKTELPSPREHHGMRCVTLPALRMKRLETLSHTTLAAAHLTASRRFDVAFLFGMANAPLIPLIRARGTAIAIHVDGLESTRRERTGPGGRRPRMTERTALREADALIADARGIRDFYADEFGIPSELITYGTTILRHTPSDLIEQLGLVPGGFHLAVAPFVPEHHVDVIVEGYHRSSAHLPLVVVGSAARTTVSTQGIRALAERDRRIRLLDGVRDARLLDQLYTHAISYLHGRGTGGTAPSLVRAMGAGTPVLAWDGAVNREVAGTGGLYFDSAPQLTRQIEDVERYPMRFADLGELMQERAAGRYDWNQVTEAYEGLAAKLTRGYSTRGMSSGRRVTPVST